MKLIDCTQGSPEWLGWHVNRVSASRSKNVMAFKTTGDKGEKEERANYRAEVVMSVLTGRQPEHYVSKDMEYGTEMEPLARTAYGFHKDVDVEQIGFALHDSIDRFGASPDGLIGTDGGLEIKVPRITTFIKWCKEFKQTQTLPAEHYWQCVAGMAVCDRQWWDFCAYCPDMPKNMRLLIVRLHRDEAAIAKLEAGVVQFLAEVDADVAEMESIFGKAPALTDTLRKSLDTDPEFGGISQEDIDWIQAQQRVM